MSYTMPMPKKTAYLALRISPQSKGALVAIADDLGLSLTSAAEFVIRDYAKRNGIKPADAPQKPAPAPPAPDSSAAAETA